MIKNNNRIRTNLKYRKIQFSKIKISITHNKYKKRMNKTSKSKIIKNKIKSKK